MSLPDGDRRLAYFYSHGAGVLCPACAESILDRALSEAASVTAHYFTDRLLRCGGCLVWIGPTPEEVAS